MQQCNELTTMQYLFSPLIKIYKALYLFAYDITGNYGFALVLLSLFTFVVLYPFNKKAQQIQKKEHKIQAVLAPQVSAIKKQYSGQEQYEQLQWLYRRYGYHPLYAIRSAIGLILQIPFLTAAYYMLSNLAEIQGVSWGFIPNLGAPDHLLGGINLLPFVMTLVTVIYAFVMPEISRKERVQTVAIGLFFLFLLYNAPSALLIFWTCNLLWSLADSVLSKKLMWLGDFISENELVFHIIFALALTVCFLVPADIYIKNASQLWFSFKDIGKFFLLDTVKIILVLLFLYLVCWRKRIRIAYLSVLIGLLLGAFLQCYIVGVDYGTFDGHEINWEEFTTVGIINTIVWITCMICGFIAFRKLLQNRIYYTKIIKISSFVIIVTQLVSLLYTLINNPIQRNVVFEDGKAGILTTKNIFTVSAKKNIIVFLLDSFDSSVFEEILQRNDSEVGNLFKDFTYFPDVISSYGFTHYSLPEILTGRLFLPGENFVDYQASAWQDNPYYKKLIDNGFLIDLYTSGNYINKNALIDNLVAEKIIMNYSVADKFNQLVKFRLVPHYFKKYYYRYDTDIQNPLISADKIEAYTFDDRKYYLGLKKGLHVSNHNHYFKFYHLIGLHQPFVLDENVEPVKIGQGNAFKQGMGVLSIVSEYLNQMKQYRIYDEAAIVLIADHGQHNLVGSRPILLMKKARANNKSMVINESPLIVADLMPLLLKQFPKEIMQEVYSEFGHQRFYYIEGDHGQFIRYKVKSPANNLKSWKKLGEVQKWNEVKNRDYRIGEIIDFSYFGNSLKYKGFGWNEREESRGSIISNDKAEVILDIKDLDNCKRDFVIKVTGSMFYNGAPYHGNIRIYGNQQFLGEWTFREEPISISCKLPKEILIRQRPFVLTFLIDKPSNSIGRNSLMFHVQKVQILEDLSETDAFLNKE